MRSAFIPFVAWLCLMSAPAQADLCRDIQDAERIEAAFLDNTNAASPVSNTTLRRLRSIAMSLSQASVRDPDLEVAIQRYATHVLNIGPSTNGFATRDHRALLRRMVAISTDLCGENTAQSPTTTSNAEPVDLSLRGISRIVRQSWKTALPLAFLFLIGTLLAGVLVVKLWNRRKIRRVRHICFIEIGVQSDTAKFGSKMVDISGYGAKFRLPEGCDIGKSAVLSVAEQTFPVKIMWHNTHFAGCTFDQPLDLRLLKKLSQGVQDRPLSNRKG